ncbi:phosphate-starvation-inducible E-like protein [Synechococcus moorigangaii CMS01]|nr:phosphate-starvation-inducible E-like protein [Synechococcus moorigangaii CMS01]
MLNLFKRYERLMIQVLLVMMAIAIGLATLDFGWVLFQNIMSPPVLLINADQLLDVFSLFMLIIIGIELLESIINTYLSKGRPHFEVVLSVAIIAIARKVIILDIKSTNSLSLFGIAAIILSLTIGYYFMKQSHPEDKIERRLEPQDYTRNDPPYSHESKDHYE